MSTYRVKLNDFEGPLDLLLFFIKRDELDIYDIPISKITQDFLEYLHLMASLDLEVAGEFIVMAATLMHIKVRMLLPRESGPDGEEEDPRAELVRRLVEYKRYKEKAQELSAMEDQQRKIFYRTFYAADPVQHDENDDDLLKDITLFNLIAAYKKALDNLPKKVVHEVELYNVTIEEQMSYTLDYLRLHKEATLLNLVSHMTEKSRIIVTVIALLEMTKNKVIALLPAEEREDVVIRPIVPLHDRALEHA
ncbi:MAG: segregation/condensation protein A [Ignavibacteria bacterium]